MKGIFSIFLVSLLFVSHCSFSQNNDSVLAAKWLNLKVQLQRRTGIIDKMADALVKSTKVDKEQLKNSKAFGAVLYKYVDTLKHYDSSSISLANAKNNQLTQAIARTLATLESDPKFRDRDEIVNLMMQLEGTENRIAIAKNDYNNACKEYKRVDLLFGKNEQEKVPEVRF